MIVTTKTAFLLFIYKHVRIKAEAINAPSVDRLIKRFKKVEKRFAINGIDRKNGLNGRNSAIPKSFYSHPFCGDFPIGMSAT